MVRLLVLVPLLLGASFPERKNPTPCKPGVAAANCISGEHFNGVLDALAGTVNVANHLSTNRIAGTTDDTNAIRAAAAAAGATGKSLGFPDGVYKVTGSVTISSGVRVFAIAGSPVILIAGVDPAAPATNYSAFQLAAKTTVEGLTFRGENSPYAEYDQNQSAALDSAIGVDDVAIRGNRFENLFGFSIHHQASGKRHTITDNVMVDCANGLNDNADHSTISGNILYRAEGIEASGAYSTYANNVITLGGLSMSGSLSALSIGGRTNPANPGPGVTVTGNVIVDSRGHGITLNDGVLDATVTGNVVIRSQRNGIVVPTTSGGAAPARIVISGNTVRSAGAETELASSRVGILLLAGSDITVTGNTVSTGSDTGYSTMYGLLSYRPNTTVIGNQLAATLKAISLSGAEAAGAIVQGNRLTGAIEAIGGATFAPPTMLGLSTYADNAAALAGGLVANDFYRTTTGELRVVVAP